MLFSFRLALLAGLTAPAQAFSRLLLLWPDVGWSPRKKTVSRTHRFPSFLTIALGLLLFTLFISKLFGVIWKTNKIPLPPPPPPPNLGQGHYVTKDLYHERCLSNYANNCKTNPRSIPHGLWALRLELSLQAISSEENYTSLDGSALKRLGKVGEQTDTPCSSQHHFFYTESAQQVAAESSGSGQEPEKGSCFWTEATESCPGGELSHTMWDGSSRVIR